MKTSYTTTTEGDTIYLNASIVNIETSRVEIPAIMTLNTHQPILDKASDYRMIISRFSIPGRAIPLFFFQTEDFPNSNPNTGIYSVTIGYQGNYSAPVSLILVPETLTPPKLPLFSPQTPSQDEQDTYYYVYSYSNLANMVTTALRTAINSVGFLPIGVDAYMTYNSVNSLFSLFGTNNMASSGSPFDPNNVQIFFNTPLSTFFTGFKSIHKSYNNINGQDELILIENTRINTTATQDGFNPNIPDGYYQMQEEFNSDSSLETLTRIIITSNGFGGVLAQSEINSQLSSGGYGNIVADFVPAASIATGSYRSKLQYYAQSEFYRRTLTSGGPLVSINLNFQWQGIRPSTIRQLILEPGDTLSIQFVFEKKT